MKESPDWCADAGGHWITHEGKHLCVDIKDYQKVPKEIRDEVAQGEKDYRKVSAKRVKAAEYRKRKKLAHELTSAWSHRPKDRAHLERHLQRYKSEHLERVKLEFDQRLRGSLRPAEYDSDSEKIFVNPENAYGKFNIDLWLDHEMGHHVAKVTEGTVHPAWTRKYLTGENRLKFEGFLGSYAVEGGPAELYAEAWWKLMLKPNKVKQRMKKDKVIKEFYTTLQERSGYSMSEIGKRRKRGGE
ncbi:MAG: hypothetical protein PVF15_03480 [Candidatus Bathyarchaeota archaeon]